MADRFYFLSTGTPDISPTPDTGWEQTGQMTRLPLASKMKLPAPTALTSSASITIPITTTQQICCYQLISEDTFLPLRFASMVFTAIVRCNENANSNNASLGWSLRALSRDGNRELAALSVNLSGAGTEFSTAQQTRITGSQSLSATTIREPWRLVLELGALVSSPTAAGSFVMRVGNNAASDFAFTSGLTTDLNPWMDLDGGTGFSLNTTKLNNYQSLRAGDGISTSGAAR